MVNYNYLKTSSQVGQANESTHRKSFENKAARKRLGSDEEHFIKYRTVLDDSSSKTLPKICHKCCNGDEKSK